MVHLHTIYTIACTTDNLGCLNHHHPDPSQTATLYSQTCSRDHLYIKISFCSPYIFSMLLNLYIYEDHLSNATRDRPIVGPYMPSYTLAVYNDHNVRLCFAITSTRNNIMDSELACFCSHTKAGVQIIIIWNCHNSVTTRLISIIFSFVFFLVTNARWWYDLLLVSIISYRFRCMAVFGHTLLLLLTD